MTNYQPDFFLFIMTIAGIVVSFVELIRKPQSNFKAKYALFVGILLIIFSLILNCLLENRWDADFITALLCLKKISNRWFAHAGIFVSLGYIFIVFGLITLLFRTSRFKNDDATQPVNSTVHRSISMAGRRVYVNAKMSSAFTYVVEYGIPLILFLIVPLALVYYFVAYLMLTNYKFTIITFIGSALSCSILLVDVLIFFILRKNWVKEIIVDIGSISLAGFYKKINVTWAEVLSAEVDASAFSKRIKVKTKKGDFFFPLTMKEKDAEYPKIDSLQDQWIDANGTGRPITVDNCALFNEIQSHLRVT